MPACRVSKEESLRSVVVHPDPRSTNLLRFVVREAGHKAVLAETGESARDVVVGQETTAMLLEMDLPDQDGFDVCTGLRESRYTGPILIVTKRPTMADRLQAFAHRADDGIADPADPAEQGTRVEAVARRFQCTDDHALGRVLKVGDTVLEISDLSYRVPVWEPVVLTPIELQLLRAPG